LELPEHDSDRNYVIQTLLDKFVSEPDINVNIDDNLNISKWYYISSQVNSISPTEIDGDFFNTTMRSLNNNIVAGKSLKHLNNDDTFLCIEKEIYLYHEHQLNNSDYIIKFRGYSVYNCKPMLFYDYAKYDLFTYFQVNHKTWNLLKDWKDKIKLAWGISQGVKYLHDVRIKRYIIFFKHLHEFNRIYFLFFTARNFTFRPSKCKYFT
jgi:hypothetical protein